MTPQERQLVEDLFDRLATLERNPRDPDAVRVINEGLSRAPNALYALVQTVLVQDEALKRADARIHELEERCGEAPRETGGGGFLENMRDAVLGRRDPQRGSVPSVGGSGAPMGTPPGFRTEQGYRPEPGYGGGYGGQPGGYPPQGGPQGGPGFGGGGGGGSFLGTAAAAAAGVIGGSMLLNSIRGMMGGQGGTAQAATDPSAAGVGGEGSPWGGGGGGDLARQAGLEDIGRSGGSAEDAGGSRGLGLFEEPPSDSGQDEGSDFDSDFDAGGSEDI
jgi:hypothetical protein